MLGQHTGAAAIGSMMFQSCIASCPEPSGLPVAVPCVAAFTASSTMCSEQSLERQAVSHPSTAVQTRSLTAQLVRAALTLVLAVLVLTDLATALVLAVLVLAALATLALAALVTGTEVSLGTLLALLDLVAEASTCALVSEFPGVLEAFVNLIGMLAGELLRFVLKLGEIGHGSPPVPESCGCHLQLGTLSAKVVIRIGCQALCRPGVILPRTVAGLTSANGMTWSQGHVAGTPRHGPRPVRTRPRPRLVLVTLALATPVPGPAMPLPATRLRPYLGAAPTGRRTVER